MLEVGRQDHELGGVTTHSLTMTCRRLENNLD